MCGRATLTAPADVVRDLFEVSVPELLPRYNLAPTQDVLIVRAGRDGPRRETGIVRWGLVPPWAKDARVGARYINARAESVFEKSPFKEPLKRRRCLVIFDGFYEWRREGTRKTPFYVRMKTGAPFGCAGLWETWRTPEGQRLESCTVLTTRANGLIGTLHDRMPSILKPDEHDAWLDPAREEPDLGPVLRPYPDGEMEMWQVSSKVNRWQNDEPSCIAPIV